MSSSFEEYDDRIESESYNEDVEPIYEPERVIGSRKEKGIIEYLVKWKGFEKSDSTWETSGIPQNLIDEYIERLSLKKSKTKSMKTESKISESKKSESKSERKKSDSLKDQVTPKSIIDSFMRFENDKVKIYYIVLMSDQSKVQYPSKKVKAEIPKLGIQFLEGFSRR